MLLRARGPGLMQGRGQAASVTSPTRNGEKARSTRVGEDEVAPGGWGLSWPAEGPLRKPPGMPAIISPGILRPSKQGATSVPCRLSPTVPGSLCGGRKEDRNSPLPQHQSAFPSAHVGVGQLGLKPCETHHLAPDSRLPHPRPGFNKHCTDGSTKLFWPDPSSLAHCMS